MPELDPTSPFARLINMVCEYRDIIDLTESGNLETEEIRILLGDRSVLHDAIIEEMQRLKIPVVDRDDAMIKAYQYAQWFCKPEEDYDL